MITVSDLITRGNRYLNSIGVRVEDADWYDFTNTAIRTLKRGRTLPWQKKETDFDFYTDIFKYQLPSDFDSFIKPNKPLIASKVDGSYYLDNPRFGVGGVEGPYLQYGREKDFYANAQVKLALTFEQETKYLLSRITGTNDLKLEGFEDAASDYTIAGDGSNGVADDINFREGAQSLRFDIADSTNATTISRTKTDVVDISDFINLGKVFLHVYMPTAITSVAIRYGSDASNYYEIAAVTTQFTGASFQVGWNILSFDMRDATTTGTPDDDNIDYYLITIDNTGVSDNNFRVDGLYFKLGNNYRFPYNSKNAAQNAAGTDIEDVSATTDNIYWDSTYSDILLYKAIELAGFFKFRDNEMSLEIKRMLFQEMDNFNRRFPSNEALVTSQYYRKANSF